MADFSEDGLRILALLACLSLLEGVMAREVAPNRHCGIFGGRVPGFLRCYILVRGITEFEFPNPFSENSAIRIPQSAFPWSAFSPASVFDGIGKFNGAVDHLWS